MCHWRTSQQFYTNFIQPTWIDHLGGPLLWVGFGTKTRQGNVSSRPKCSPKNPGLFVDICAIFVISHGPPLGSRSSDWATRRGMNLHIPRDSLRKGLRDASPFSKIKICWFQFNLLIFRGQKIPIWILKDLNLVFRTKRDVLKTISRPISTKFFTFGRWPAKDQVKQWLPSSTVQQRPGRVYDSISPPKCG